MGINITERYRDVGRFLTERRNQKNLTLFTDYLEENVGPIVKEPPYFYLSNKKNSVDNEVITLDIANLYSKEWQISFNEHPEIIEDLALGIAASIHNKKLEEVDINFRALSSLEDGLVHCRVVVSVPPNSEENHAVNAPTLGSNLSRYMYEGLYDNNSHTFIDWTSVPLLRDKNKIKDRLKVDNWNMVKVLYAKEKGEFIFARIDGQLAVLESGTVYSLEPELRELPVHDAHQLIVNINSDMLASQPELQILDSIIKTREEASHFLRAIFVLNNQPYEFQETSLCAHLREAAGAFAAGQLDKKLFEVSLESFKLHDDIQMEEEKPAHRTKITLKIFIPTVATETTLAYKHSPWLYDPSNGVPQSGRLGYEIVFDNETSQFISIDSVPLITDQKTILNLLGAKSFQEIICGYDVTARELVFRHAKTGKIVRESDAQIKK